MMAKSRHTAEQITAKLREAQVLLAKGGRMAQVCRKLGVTEQTYYRWRKEYGGVRVDQVKRLKELEKDNARSGVFERLPRHRTIRDDLGSLWMVYDAAVRRVTRMRQALIRPARKEEPIVRFQALPGVKWIRASHSTSASCRGRVHFLLARRRRSRPQNL